MAPISSARRWLWMSLSVAVLGSAGALGAVPVAASPPLASVRTLLPASGSALSTAAVGNPSSVAGAGGSAVTVQPGQRSWPDLPQQGSAITATAQQTSGSAYTALTPTRMLDTRVTGATLGAGGSLNLTVTGGLVPTDATAVALNVTVTNTTAASYLAVYPAGATRPVVSSLDWSAGQSVPNLVMVAVGSNGQVSFYNHAGRADLVVDLEGYFAPESGSSTAGSYVPLAPARITDTRSGSGYPNSGDRLGPGATLNVQVSGAGGVPGSGAAAVLINLTATNTSSAGYLTAYPQGTARPLASNLNWTAGKTVANRVVVPLGPTGMISVANASGSADVVIDVNGYFSDGSSTPSGASLFTAISPVRVLDTRLTGGTLHQGQTLNQQLAGSDGLAPGATAVVANVTATDTTAASFLTVFPGAPMPTASDLNWSPGQLASNLTVATLSGSGSVSVYNQAGSADVIVDAFGYFTPLASPLVITTSSLPGGTEQVPYSFDLAASGGVHPYTWALTSGSLPAGLTLSSAGVISGTPGAPSAATFTVQVTDSSSPTPQVATAQLSLAVVLAGLPTTTATTMGTSSNWSGYAAIDGHYTAIAGTFQVPSLGSAQSGSYMGEWVGIDGWGSSTVIQAGIDEQPNPANPQEFFIQPWWEVFPAAANPITTMTVAPGDSITVSIGQVTSGIWSITMTDTTTGQTFQIDPAYNGLGASAEWIVEAPGIPTYPLAAYTTTGFSQLQLAGTEGALAEIAMVQNGVQVSTPSALNARGFAIAYGDVPPPAP
ncbi:MAG: G1 family glutamic endopeptidase [Acidimicrobiales bacterium]